MTLITEAQRRVRWRQCYVRDPVENIGNPAVSAAGRSGAGRPDRHRGRLDDRQWHLRTALADGRQRGSRAAAHRLGDHRRRNADAGLRVSDAGPAKARGRRRCLRLRPRRVRQLHRLHVGLRLLGFGVDGQRRLPGSAVLHAGLLLPGVRGRHHRAGHHRRLHPVVDRSLPDPARRADRRLRQRGRHHRQDRADPDVHRHRDRGLQGRRVHRGLLGTSHRDRRKPVGQHHGSGQEHDAGHRLGVHRHRRRGGVLAARQEAQGRRPGDGGRLPRRSGAAAGGELPVLRPDGTGQAGWSGGSLHGRPDGAAGRQLGSRIHLDRPDHLAAGRPPRLGAAVRRDSAHTRPGRRDARRCSGGRMPTVRPPRRCG